MGRKTVTTITNMDVTPKEFFFTTDHQQELGEEFVPTTWYNRESYLNVREECISMGDVEIINPDYNFIPDYILEELTKPVTDIKNERKN